VDRGSRDARSRAARCGRPGWAPPTGLPRRGGGGPRLPRRKVAGGPDDTSVARINERM